MIGQDPQEAIDEAAEIPEDHRVPFLEGIDEENATQELWKSLNQLYNYASQLTNYKYHLLIYKLAKQGVKIKELTAATGWTRQHIHDIVRQFEEREIERRHREEA